MCKFVYTVIVLRTARKRATVQKQNSAKSYICFNNIHTPLVTCFINKIRYTNVCTICIKSRDANLVYRQKLDCNFVKPSNDPSYASGTWSPRSCKLDISCKVTMCHATSKSPIISIISIVSYCLEYHNILLGCYCHC